MKPANVWRTDFARVTNAELVVAYVGVRSLGVGSEIEMARAGSVPVILVCEVDCVPRVSRLVLGSPAVYKMLAFENHEHLRRLLVDAIRSVQRSRQSASMSSLNRFAEDIVTAAKHKSRGISTPAEADRARPKLRRQSA
jgi:hypothetical protein